MVSKVTATFFILSDYQPSAASPPLDFHIPRTVLQRTNQSPENKKPHDGFHHHGASASLKSLLCPTQTKRLKPQTRAWFNCPRLLGIGFLCYRMDSQIHFSFPTFFNRHTYYTHTDGIFATLN
jgi:hypothetical protein